ncbi:MAG: 4-coumarate--CoA ligase family protein, partial [Thermoanaerobaculia bacterium]
MIFTAPEGPLAIPDVALTPFLLERATLWGEKAAFVDAATGRVLTFRDWADAVKRIACSLAARGLRKGDVFAIF